MLAIGGVYFLLRSRVGLVLTAIRDDERAARSSGVRVGLARLLVFIVAAAGCGAAGGVLAIEQLQVVPGTSGGVFSVQWTAEMAFAVIIGGIGTIEGPIVGTIVYMVLQQTLQSYNAWYLIVLGIVAIVIALFARRGLWGTVDERFNIRLFPVGYHLWAPGERRGEAARRRTPRRGLDHGNFIKTEIRTAICGPNFRANPKFRSNRRWGGAGVIGGAGATREACRPPASRALGRGRAAQWEGAASRGC